MLDDFRLKRTGFVCDGGVGCCCCCCIPAAAAVVRPTRAAAGAFEAPVLAMPGAALPLAPRPKTTCARATGAAPAPTVTPDELAAATAATTWAGGGGGSGGPEPMGPAEAPEAAVMKEVVLVCWLACWLAAVAAPEEEACCCCWPEAEVVAGWRAFEVVCCFEVADGPPTPVKGEFAATVADGLCCCISEWREFKG